MELTPKAKETIEKLKNFKSDDYDWKQGKTWSLVYYLNDELDQVLRAASQEYVYESTLNPMIFSSARKMEKEVIRFAIKMLHGDNLEDCSGLITTGGTESIIMALKSYRNIAAKKNILGWKKNEIIIPASAHVAFEKGADLLGLKVKKADLDANYQVDLKHVEKLISSRTMLLVGSAPQYPHGVVDNIEGLSDLAIKNRLPLHVDGCLGGYFLPWLEKIGHDIPVFDFRLKGVTSISLDNHKFGYSLKGASTLVYRDINTLAEQFFITTDWCGGMYASPSFPGTKGVAPIAAAFAAMDYLGEEGYIKNAKMLMEHTEKLKAELLKVPELQLVGKPIMNVFAITSKDSSAVNVFILADKLQEKGWHVDRQYKPDAIHFILNPHHLLHIEKFLFDFEASVSETRQALKDNKSIEGNAGVYGLVAKIPKGFNSMVKKEIKKIMTKMYHLGHDEYSDSLELPQDDWKVNLLKRVLKVFKP